MKVLGVITMGRSDKVFIFKLNETVISKKSFIRDMISIISLNSYVRQGSREIYSDHFRFFLLENKEEFEGLTKK